MKRITGFMFLFVIHGQIFSQNLIKIIKENHQSNRNREQRISSLIDQKLAGKENRLTWLSEFCMESEVFMNTEVVGYTLSQSPLLNENEKLEAKRYFPNFPPVMNREIVDKIKLVNQKSTENPEDIFHDFMQIFLSNYLLKMISTPTELTHILNDEKLSISDKKFQAEIQFANTYASYFAYKKFSTDYKNAFGNLMKDDFVTKLKETDTIYQQIMNLK